MYKILGADGKEYGPVSAEQIRSWIQEGRVNALTQVQLEGTLTWQALSAFPELAAFLAAVPPISPGIAVSSGRVDIGHCFSRGWTLFKANAGLLIGATLIVFLIMGAAEVLVGQIVKAPMLDVRNFRFSPALATAYFLQSLPGMIIYPVLYSGLYGLALKLIRGQPASLGDVFSGFQTHPFSIAIASVLISILTGVGLLLCLIPGIYISIAWIFTFPLIIDKGFGSWTAMETSRKIVTKQWFLVFGLVLAVSALMLCGILACCIGVIVSTPLAAVVLMYAYEDIFSSIS